LADAVGVNLKTIHAAEHAAKLRLRPDKFEKVLKCLSLSQEEFYRRLAVHWDGTELSMVRVRVIELMALMPREKLFELLGHAQQIHQRASPSLKGRRASA